MLSSLSGCVISINCITRNFFKFYIIRDNNTTGITLSICTGSFGTTFSDNNFNIVRLSLSNCRGISFVNNFSRFKVVSFHNFNSRINNLLFRTRNTDITCLTLNFRESRFRTCRLSRFINSRLLNGFINNNIFFTSAINLFIMTDSFFTAVNFTSSNTNAFSTVNISDRTVRHNVI